MIVTVVGAPASLSGLDLAKTTRALGAGSASAAAAHGDDAQLARLTHELQPEHVSGSPFTRLAASASGGIDLLSWPGEEEPLAGGAPARDAETSFALYAATYCAESQLPWSPDSPLAGRAAALRSWLAALPAGSTAPFSRTTAAEYSPLAICEEWPATPLAPPPPGGISPTPTLILSGEDDLRTPYEQDLEVQEGYSDVRLLRIPDTGHSTASTDSTGCAKDAMLEFLTTGQAPVFCPGSREPQALPLPPTSLGDPHAFAAHSSLANCVATATVMTLEDLFGQTSFSGGGLRGGDYELEPNGYALHGMVDIPGVTLSGNIHVGDTGLEPKLSGHLIVHGRLNGTLILRGRLLSGRLDGTYARTRLAVLP